MPTNCDETLQERYIREHNVYLGILSKMTPEEICDLQRKYNNALSACDYSLFALNEIYGQIEYIIRYIEIDNPDSPALTLLNSILNTIDTASERIKQND